MGSAVDDVLAFLRQHADQQFCRTCLAFEFKLTFQSVDSALAAVGQQVALTELRGQCAICGQRALVTGLDPSHHRSPQERVLLFFLDHTGRLFCHACIGRRLELNIGTVQKAVADLRASSNVRIDDAPCSECGHQRLVVGREDGSISPR